jgi:hypothetical protein
MLIDKADDLVRGQESRIDVGMVLKEETLEVPDSKAI